MKTYTLKIILFFCLILIAFFSCKKTKEQKKYNKLRSEVINHYKFDTNPLKVRAAKFLLDNMKDGYSIVGERYDRYVDSIKKRYNIHDSLFKSLSLLKELNLNEKMVTDIDTITSEYLINNIDNSFTSWNNAGWKNEISFDNFCEYILPYRIGNEPLEDWRSSVLQDTLTKITGDTLKSFITIAEAAECFVKKQSKLKKTGYKPKYGNDNVKIPDVPFSILKLLSVGSCANISNYGVLANRATGIPATIDFVPSTEYFPMGHEWISVINNTKQIQYSLPLYGDTLGNYYAAASNKPEKIFRRTFSIKKNSHAQIMGYCDYLPSHFNDSRIIDVTGSYQKTFTIQIPNVFNTDCDKMAYVCSSIRENWIPIGWGKFSKGKADFENLIPNYIYLPASITKSGIQYLNAPFYLTTNGDIKYIIAYKQKTQSITLTRKFPLKERIKYYIDTMIGGKFQFANNSEFNKAETVYTIKKSPGVYYNEIPINISHRYRYVRYVGPDSSFCNVGEIKFYENKEDQSLKGEVIGENIKWSAESIRKAFDDDDLTFPWVGKKHEPWVGLDLGEPKEISKIRFVTRNDKNHIIPGNLYELFYWNNGWISLGQQIAKSYKLIYEKIPTECLFYLRNLTEGKEERPFTYENGEQVFW